MDEYINREDALKIIDSYSKACTEEGKIVADAIKDIIAVITPTADVVPKSEIEKLELTLQGVMWSVDKWLDEKDYDADPIKRAITMREKTLQIVEKLEQDNEGLRNVLANTINKYRNCEAEVAREIFEEIDNEILAEIDLCNGVLIEFEEADEPYHRIKGEVSALCKIQDFIAELKKKYTEGVDGTGQSKDN